MLYSSLFILKSLLNLIFFNPPVKQSITVNGDYIRLWDLVQRVKWSISVRHLPVSAKVGFSDHADKAILLKVFPYLNANWHENRKRGTELCTLYRLHYFLHESVESFTQYNICTAYPLSRHGELSRDFAKLWRRRRRQRQRQKAIDLVSKTTTLHVHYAFLCISLPPMHDYDVKF